VTQYALQCKTHRFVRLDDISLITANGRLWLVKPRRKSSITLEVVRFPPSTIRSTEALKIGEEQREYGDNEGDAVLERQGLNVSTSYRVQV
jgi:hypothetical protein